VAVKIISSKNVKSDREKMQIQREREILLRLKHPNIVELKKVVDDEKRMKTYMIFEYVSGGELFDYIVAHGRLAERDARRFMRQVRCWRVFEFFRARAARLLQSFSDFLFRSRLFRRWNIATRCSLCTGI